MTALVGLTDYTVQEGAVSGERVYVHSDSSVINAPNNYDQHKYSCHHNSNCHGLDWEKWDCNAKACNVD